MSNAQLTVEGIAGAVPVSVDVVELPTAAVLGDALPNPTASAIGAYLLGWTGAVWRRVPVDVNTGALTLLRDSALDGILSGGFLDDQGLGAKAALVLPTGYTGVGSDRLRTPNIFRAPDAVAIAVEATIWTPAAGKKFRVMGYHLVSSVAGNILLRDNLAGTIIAVVPSAAGGAGIYVSLGNGILSAVADNVLTADGPAASTLSGIIFGTEE